MGYIGAGISRFNTADDLTVSGDADIDGTTNLDVVDIDGAVDMASTLQVDGAITSSTGLTVLNTGAVATLRLEGDVGTAPHAEVQFAHENYTTGYGASIGTFDAGSFGGGLVFKTLASGSASSTPSEVMRIDNSGNLLVGKTADNVATVGIEARGTGPLISTRDGSDALRLNRLNSDGEIIQLRKDGTTVGSIGALSSRMFVGTGDVGLFFDSNNNMLTPYSTDAGDTVDNAIDLGYSSRRFRHGYFANTVYTASVAGITDNDTYLNFANNNILQFVIGGSERGRIDSSGNHNFNYTGFDAGLGNTTTGVSIRADNIVALSSASGYLSINRNGDGTRIQFNNSGNTRGTITVTGTSTAYNTSSDRRLKSNIQDAESASAKIDAMQVRQFDWTEDGSHQDYGMIAQELKAIEPLAVSGDENSDEMMGVDYSKLVPMLLKEIQELRSRVAALEE